LAYHSFYGAKIGNYFITYKCIGIFLHLFTDFIQIGGLLRLTFFYYIKEYSLHHGLAQAYSPSFFTRIWASLAYNIAIPTFHFSPVPYGQERKTPKGRNKSTDFAPFYLPFQEKPLYLQ
jgi:hypothetical protein